MSEPTPGERAFASRLGLDAADVAAARDTLNLIASLPWPRNERVSLLARLARAAAADVGEGLGGLALDAAPIDGLDRLLPIHGLGDKRVAGLARVLASFDPSTLSTEGARLRDAWATIASLHAENAALRGEVDRLRAQQPVASTEPGQPAAPSVMRIADVAASVGSQVTLVDRLLRSRSHGLRLGAVDLRLRGAGTAAEGDVALDLAAPAGGSSVGLSFVSGGAANEDAGHVPVPDVSGYTTALAERKLAARGFTVAIATLTGAQGIVSEQSPSPSAVAPRGSVVRLVVR